MKISIVIPSLNQGKYIAQAIQSVIRQDHPFELFIVDGGSTDNTIEVIREFEGQITWWVSEKDAGQAAAINKGFARCTGDVVTWLNSDDVYEAGAFRRTIEIFRSQPGTALVHGKARLFGDTKEKIVGTDCGLPPHMYLPYMRFPQPASFFSAEALKKVLPLDESLHYAMDFDIAARMVLQGMHIACIPDVLAGYRLHADSKSNHDERFLIEWSRELVRIFRSLKEGQRFAEYLQSLGLGEDAGDATFPATIHLSQAQLTEVFLEHLRYAFHCYYRLNDAAATRRVAAFVRTHYPGYYRKESLSKYVLRQWLLPGPVINLLRKLR